MSTENWFFALFGLSGGLVVSFAFWWWLNHHLVPHLEFSEEISRRPIEYDLQSHRHQIAIANSGNRDIINLRLKARLVIIDPFRRGSTIKNLYTVSLPSNELFDLQKGTIHRIAPIFRSSESLLNPILDERIIIAYNDKILTLDHVFECYPDAYFYIQAIGTDVYSHSTRVFTSKHYRKTDVRNGVFKAGTMDITALYRPTQAWESRPVASRS